MKVLEQGMAYDFPENAGDLPIRRVERLTSYEPREIG
jgi:hypothetical protein